MEFRDLKTQYHILKKDIDSAISEAIVNTNFISGSPVKELEQQLADYVGVKHCITCANGTDALILPLMAWRIEKGDAVFVPDFTFFASGEAPALLGATPVFVDIEKDTFNISPLRLEKAIKQVIEDGKLKPRVIVAVDLFGQPANYEEIHRIAKRYDLLVLEDGAQGFGGAIRNKKACSFGDVGATSFFPAKPLGCYGDGGAIFTDNDEWAEIIRSLCIHGKGKDKYDNVRIGMNSRLDTIQAAILQVKLKQFVEYELKQENKIAKEYTNQLQDIVETPTVLDGYTSSWAQYTIVCKDEEERNNLQKALKESGIPAMIYYAKGMHEQKAFENRCVLSGDYENAMYLSRRVLALPMGPYITEIDMLNIIKKIKVCLGGNL